MRGQKGGLKVQKVKKGLTGKRSLVARSLLARSDDGNTNLSDIDVSQRASTLTMASRDRATTGQRGFVGRRSFMTWSDSCNQQPARK